MKKLLLFILLVSLVCLVGLLAACNTETPITQDPCANGHAPQTDEASPASCTVAGLTEGSHCTRCQKILVAQERVELLAHTEGEWVDQISATCTQTGVREKSCTVCNTILSTEVVESAGHTFDTWSVQVAATCQNTGVESSVCLSCGETQTKTTDKLAHTAGGWILDVSASCETTGSRHKNCVVCGAVALQENIKALGHLNESWTRVKEPTCTAKGEEVSGCTRCGQTQTRAVDALPHTMGNDWIIDVVPSCIAQGSRHKECTKCKTVLVAEAISSPDHVVTDNWIVTKMPTATTAGESVKLCTGCGMVTQASATRLDYGSTIALELTASVPLIGYSVIYKQPASTHDYFSATLTHLCAALKTATGGTYSAKVDTTTRASTKEILIGRTNRPESQEAYASLSGRAFTVRTVGDKIVILGTDDALTLTAVQYFVNQYLGDDFTITMSLDATATDLTARPLAPTTGSNFVYVLDADLDSDPLHMYVGASSDAVPGDGRDYPVYLFEKLLAQISVRSSLALSAFPALTDTNTTHQNGYEVLFGEVDRAESLAFRTHLAANEYGFAVWGNKVIITAHTDAGLKKALEAFLSFYDYLLATTDGVLPQSYAYIDVITDQNWIVSFPQPDGVTIKNAQNNNDDSIQIIYTGDSATAAGYLAYCRKLEEAGYTIVTQNDDPGNTGNYFRTYQNAEKAHVLYVAYNAFAAQEDYAEIYAQETKQYGDFIHYYSPNSYAVNYPMHTYEQCIRVVSAPLDKAYLPDSVLLSQQSYTKICESSITTMRLYNGDVGMCYILQLEDGSFVIVDGGNHHDENYTREKLYATLSELHKRATGAAPSTSNPLHITAWLVTHSHGDHYANMTSFLKKYAPGGTVKMDYLIGNFPEVSTIYPVGGDTTVMGGTRIPTLQGYFTSAKLPTFKFVKVHTGMTLYFANLQMETLMTYEDHAPIRITNSNDTNTVTKWTIASTSTTSGAISANTVTGDESKTTWMMLGDSCIYASRWMCAMWGGSYNSSTKMYDGGYLKADMVQLAHHGNIGCEVAMYKTIQPTVVWFPHYASSYNSYTQNGKNNWQRHVDNTAINLSCVKYIVVSGITGTSYTDSITISFNANGLYLPTRNPGWGIKYNKNTGTYTTANISFGSSSSGKVSTSPIVRKSSSYYGNVSSTPAK